MAKIKVTKINFTDYLKEKVDDMGIDGLFMSSLLGGKEQLKEAIGNLPNEQVLWVNTDYIVISVIRNTYTMILFTPRIHNRIEKKNIYQICHHLFSFYFTTQNINSPRLLYTISLLP